jgi:Peptidase family M48
MPVLGTCFRLGRALSLTAAVAAAQSTPPVRPPAATSVEHITQPSPPAAEDNAALTSAAFDRFVGSALQQEHRLIELMRNFKPILETYIQEESASNSRTSPRKDDYFLSRADLSGGEVEVREFSDPERFKPAGDKKAAKNSPFVAAAFAEAMFPDLDHFDRQNYEFEFVRWENLGDVRCAAIDVRPRGNAAGRAFAGRIWVESQNFNIVRFAGAHSSKATAKPFHFDSWRLNDLGITWMPAYIYTQESDPRDPSSPFPWFKAQTRIWGYNRRQAGENREFDKPLTDAPAAIDPNRHEASQDLDPAYTVGTTTYRPEDIVVERLQLAGLMAPDGAVDQILETVVNNLAITNNLDLPAVRCRVLLTTPLESFVVGRTIIVSRGLLDVLPDEATLAIVLAHELAHVVLRHSLNPEYLESLRSRFSDLEIPEHFNFRFDPAQEADAEKKGLEIFSKSPYKDQLEKVELFLEAVQARSSQLPNLFQGLFSNDFASSHLVGVEGTAKFPKHLEMDRLDQIPALPLGSRITLDPWSDQLEMLKTKPVPLESAAEKIPFEVSPFFPYLKRNEAQ